MGILILLEVRILGHEELVFKAVAVLVLIRDEITAREGEVNYKFTKMNEKNKIFYLTSYLQSVAIFVFE